MKRYETAIPIGQGASGEVFKAWDPENRRSVAVKLFPVGDQEVTRRWEREARAQGQLQHPSICEIYEVGVTDAGRGFIAMRYVDGEPLDHVAPRLTIWQRAQLVRTIADAVAVAHEAGLVHRDLKPGNLLVEPQDDGSWRPFVLDFGIVRETTGARLTETGQVLGTPGYLSPEQARGEIDLDARSDVFSLGVVLYEVLTGSNPFLASSGVGSLMRVLQVEPPPAHKLRPEVPEPLAFIAQRAMEKDPRRRYPDAGALARDLERFLDSAAVSARKVGLPGRLLRRAERNPRPWFAGALLALLALGSFGWAMHSRLGAERQARAAEAFARRATEVEAQLRFLELLPKRPLGRQQQRLASSLRQLARDVEATRGHARAAGEYALGRGELALGRPSVAAAHLRKALELGFDAPTASLPLSLALLDQARRDLHQAELIGDPTLRAEERHRLREDLRSEVVPLLEQAVSTEDQSKQTLARALTALLLNRFNESRALASEVLAESPWLIEADLILADIERETGAQARVRDDRDAALAAFEREQEVLRAALERAPSAASLYEYLCESLASSAQVELSDARFEDRWRSSFAAAEQACRTAETIRLPAAASSQQADRALPSRSQTLLVEIGWRRLFARLRREGGKAVEEDAARVVQAARDIVAGDIVADGLVAGDSTAEQRRISEDPVAYWNLGNALFAQARVQQELDQPHLETLEAAASAVAEGLRRAPGSAFAWLSLGNIWTRHGESSDWLGQDPLPSYRRALDAYEKGLQGSKAQQSRIFNSLCFVWNGIAYHGLLHRAALSAQEVDEALEQGARACREALARDPSYTSALSNLAMNAWTEVDWRIVQRQSPEAAAERGLGLFAELLALAPNHVSGRINRAGLVASLAAWHLDRDDSPAEPWLLEQITTAQTAVLPLARQFPADVAIHLSRLATARAAFHCRRAQTATWNGPEWQAASEARQLLPADGTRAKFGARFRAEALRRQAHCAARSGDPAAARALLEQARGAVDQALAIDPAYEEALTERRRLLDLSTQLSAS